MNPRIVISLGVFVVGFGLGYGATYMLVGSNSESDVEETTPPTASITNNVSVADGSKAEASKKDMPTAPKATPQVAPKPVAKTVPTNAVKPEVAAQPKPAEVVDKKPWWDVCLGKKCAVDFGGIKTGLSIRSGTITHKQTVDWNLRFRKAQRLNILPTDRRVKVELVAVGFDGKGKPAAAQVKWSDKGRAVSGVISLQPGEKRVKLLANTVE